MKKFVNIFILLLFPLAISAQNLLSVKVLNPQRRIKPGTHLTMFVEVSGDKTFENKIDVALLLPENWNVLMSKSPKKIIGETSIKYMFTVATPNLAKKGTYNLGIRAFGKGYTEEVENQSIEIEHIRQIEVTALTPPEFVKEGDTLQTDFMIQNLGNNPERIALKSLRGRVELPKADSLLKSDSLDLSLKINTKEKKKKKEKEIPNVLRIDSVTVAPNEILQLKVVQIIPKTDYGSWSTVTDLQVMMQDSVKPISKALTIPVFSSKLKKSDPYLRFPIDVGLWYSNFKIGDRQFGGYQFDLRGKGDLDFAQKHHLDFVVHGPNRFEVPAVGSFDQYSLEYTYKKRSKIIVGDYNLRVSNLIELGRFGRGLRLEQTTNKVNFAVFYLKPRFNPSQGETYGGSVTFKPTEKLNLTLNYESKILIDNVQKSIDANFIGLTTQYFGKKIIIENEIATSSAIGKIDFGVFNRLSWKLGRLQYNNDLVYTGKKFFGFYKDSYLLINSLNYYLSRRISLNFLNNITRLNPSLDLTVFNTSPYSSINMLSMNNQLSQTNRIFLSYEQRSREDRSINKNFNFKEKFGRIAYYVNAQKFNLWIDTRYGTTQNLLIKSDSSSNIRLFQGIIQPQFRILPMLWLGGYFDYQRTAKFSDDNTLRNFYYYGGSARVYIAKYFNATLNYRNNYAPDELFEKRTFIDVNATLHLGNHEISVVGGKAFIPNAQFVNENTTFYTIKYAFRINAPIGRNKKLSNIKGTLSNGDYSINPKGVIVQMGDQKVMADAAGYFQFNGLNADKYYINILRSSLEKGVIVGVKNPVEVHLRADTTISITIPLTKTGNVVGKINFIKSDAVGVSDITQQKPIVLLKLFNEKESFLTQVNKKDEFSFKEIKPGKYKVTAWVPGKTDQYTVGNTDQEIELSFNQTREVSISISPTVRKIQFSNKTVQLSTKK